MHPASALQLHPKVTVPYEPAAAELKLKHYYRRVYDYKPDWQKERPMRLLHSSILIVL